MGWKFQKPVVEEKPPAHRAGEKCEDPVVRAKHPAFSWGWFVADDGPGDANFDRPVNWVEEVPDDPEHDGGWWVYAKDCD